MIVPRSVSGSTAVDRCRLYVEKIGPSIAGQGGDDQLFLAACVIFWDFALDEADGMPLFHEYNGRCLPPWPDQRLTYKMNQALSVAHHPGVIDQPHLTVFGTATPQFYYSALSERMMSNGFFARMIIVDADKRPFSQDAFPVDRIGERVLDTARWWRDFQPGDMKGNLGKFHPTPITVPFDEKSTDFMRDFRRFADEEYSKAEDRGDVVAMTVWGRANENARKLALLYACSENHRQPEIAATAARWAADFVTHQIRRQLFKAKEYSSKTRFQALCKEALRQLRQWHHSHGNRGMPCWILRRQLGVMPREFTDLIMELDAQRFVKIDRIATKGRPKEIVTLLQSPQ